MESFLVELLWQFFILLLFAMFILSGVSTIVISYTNLRTSIKSKHWPRIQAKIIRYEINQYTTGGQASLTRYGYSTISFYEIQGHSYVTPHAWHGGFVTWETAEQEAFRSCPIGESVELAYNPNDPQQSRLATEVGWEWDHIIGMWFGVPFVCVGAGMSLMQISRMLGMSLGESLDITEFLIIAAQISVVTFFCFILVAMLLKAIQQYFRKIRNRNQ
jgi:hypothetical protein